VQGSCKEYAGSWIRKEHARNVKGIC
jgi:hypothetical protein